MVRSSDPEFDNNMVTGYTDGQQQHRRHSVQAGSMAESSPRHCFQLYKSTIKISTFTARFNFHDNLGLYPNGKERQDGDSFSTSCYKIISGGVQEINDSSFTSTDVNQFWDGSGSFAWARAEYR
ncbi:hypothetical protein BGZ91_003265 [Linnemannia elongata]|nr:hypothetical protein BGZ91_003265 [Linnemannia elongata]